MSHVVIVESNRSGLALLEEALRRKMTVTFIYSHQFERLWRSPRAEALLERLDHVIELDGELEANAIATALCRAQEVAPIDALITTAPWAVEPTAFAAQKLQLRFTSADAVAASCNKAVTRRTLECAGLPSAGFGEAVDVDDALQIAARIGYPVVLKPVCGFGSVSIAIAGSQQEVRNYFNALDDTAMIGGSYDIYGLQRKVLVEEKLKGELCSVELGRTVGGRSILLMIDQRKRADHDETIELGSTVPPTFDANLCDEIVVYADAVAQALGLDIGVFHIEIMATAKGPRLIEVNPRIMGGNLPELFHNATGENAMAILLDIHLGLEPPLDRLPISQAMSSRTIAPRTSGRVSTDLPDDWLGDLTPSLELWDISVEAGQEVEIIADNYNTLGFFQVSGRCALESVQRAEEMLDKIEARLSLDLTR